MTQRLYSLFRKDAGRWVRKPGAGSYTKATAVRIFQDTLLSFNGWQLRVVNGNTPTALAPSQVLCHSCSNHHHDLCRRGDCACGCRVHQS